MECEVCAGEKVDLTADNTVACPNCNLERALCPECARDEACPECGTYADESEATC